MSRSGKRDVGRLWVSEATVSDLLDTDAFARACGVKPETVRKWVRRGWLEPHGRTLGAGHMRFRPDQVDEALRRTRPAEPTQRAQDIEAHVRAAMERARLRREAM